MNRRRAIQKAVGLGVAAVAIPVLAKAVEANDRVYIGQDCNSAGQTCAPAYTPPPPDMRTPEQVIVEQDTKEVVDVIRHLTHEMYPGQRRYAYSVWSRTFDGVQAELRKQVLPIDLRVIAGVGEVLVGTNGNVARRIGQQLHFV